MGASVALVAFNLFNPVEWIPARMNAKSSTAYGAIGVHGVPATSLDRENATDTCPSRPSVVASLARRRLPRKWGCAHHLASMCTTACGTLGMIGEHVQVHAAVVKGFASDASY